MSALVFGIRKAVIPVAGLGTRLLPATKEQPKEMLPVFARLDNGTECLKPLVQLVYEKLSNFGFLEFCFVVGPGKRAIEDHFTQDYDYVEMLIDRNKAVAAGDLRNFYDRLGKSTIFWINQPEPRGFGHAILMARSFVGNDRFLVHAGDTLIISEGQMILKRLLKVHQELRADVTLVVQEVDDPRQYGVVELEERSGQEFRVMKAVEKPDKPFSNFAIMPVYVFEPTIFEALVKTSPGKDGEVQLTDAIQKMIDQRLKVCAVKMKPEETRLDIGNPKMYWETLKQSWEATRLQQSR